MSQLRKSSQTARQSFRAERKRRIFKQVRRSDPGVVTFLAMRVHRGICITAIFNNIMASVTRFESQTVVRTGSG
jgi:hypothetical protein